MFTRRSTFALAALAITVASLAASPALAGGHGGGHRLRNVQTAGHVPPPSCPGGCLKKNVGQGDTIDTGASGTPWQEVNGNLPGKGAYGN